MTDDVDKPASTPTQTDFDAKGNIAPRFEVPGVLRKWKTTTNRILGRSTIRADPWRPVCSNCGERMEELPDSPTREPKSDMLYSGWFSEHCGSYFFLCES